MIDGFVVLIVGVACFGVGYVVGDWEDNSKIEKLSKEIDKVKNAYKKVKRERDVAISQLDTLGYHFGEEIKEEDIYKDPCETCVFSDAPEDYSVCEECGEKA